MRTRLDRLMKKQADGSFKEVGRMKIEGGKIYHQLIFSPTPMWFDIMPEKYKESRHIDFDRLDQYTGIDVGGVKVFERDEGIIGGEAFTVKFINGSWSMITKRPRVDFIQDLYRNIKHARITGIEGIN